MLVLVFGFAIIFDVSVPGLCNDKVNTYHLHFEVMIMMFKIQKLYDVLQLAVRRKVSIKERTFIIFYQNIFSVIRLSKYKL